MSRLELQDAVDVGRHTWQSDALYWPRYRADADDIAAARRSEARCVAVGVALALLAPMIVWGVIVGLMWLILLRKYPAGQIHLEQADDWPAGSSLAMGLVSALAVSLVAVCWLAPERAAGAAAMLVTILAYTQATIVTIHYVWYLSAHHNNTRETEQKWRTAFATIHQSFPSSIFPARDDLTAEERRMFDTACKAFSRFVLRNVALFFTVILIGTILPEAIQRFGLVAYGDSVWRIAGDVLQLAGVVWFLGLAARVPWQWRMHARLVFVHSPPQRAADLGNDPGWSAASPFGDESHRRRWTALATISGPSLLTPWLFERLGWLLPGVVDNSPFGLSIWVEAALGVETWGDAGRLAAITLVTAGIAGLTLRAMTDWIAADTWWHAHHILDNDSD